MSHLPDIDHGNEFRKGTFSDDAAVYTDELEEDAANFERDGLQANHLGTIVHELTELRPDRERVAVYRFSAGFRSG